MKEITLAKLGIIFQVIMCTKNSPSADCYNPVKLTDNGTISLCFSSDECRMELWVYVECENSCIFSRAALLR